jgi:hypothetical protein
MRDLLEIGAVLFRQELLDCIQKGEAIRSTSWMAVAQAPMQKIRCPVLATGGKLSE